MFSRPNGILGLFLWFLGTNIFGQSSTISGWVRDSNTLEPVINATVYTLPSLKATFTDAQGYFQLEKDPQTAHIRISAIGYKTDSQFVKEKTIFHFNLQPEARYLNEVVVSATLKEMSKLESPIPVEVYQPHFFKKNPTPNVFEALNMVNGVQPQLNCNVCNTGDIHINGMEGPYTMILIDGMPIVSSLSTVYGLMGIPNSMIKRIEIVKGPASTLYGSEAVAGVINIITKDALTAPRWRMDVMGTTLQEWNADLSTKFSNRWVKSLVGINGFWFNKPHDVNGDGFTDVTLQKRISVFNKYDFIRKSGKEASLGVRFFTEDRWGGQTVWNERFRGSDSIYGESITTRRWEILGSYDLPISTQKIKFQYSYNTHFQDSYYGTTAYKALQQVAFGQFIWNKTWKTHDISMGTPLRFTYYDDNTPATASAPAVPYQNQPQLVFIPGVFLQDEWKFMKHWALLAGLRYDRNNVHGNIFTPRLSFKFSPHTQHTLRLSGGSGYRVVNLFTEDHAALTGAREVVVLSTLQPERSWNVNLNYSNQLYIKNGFVNVDFSAFYTYFLNKIVPNYDANPNQILYDNIKGYAVSQGISFSADASLSPGWKANVGATLMDVYQMNQDSLGAYARKQQEFAPAFSATYALSYTHSDWGTTIDLTGRTYSPMALPVLPNDFRPDHSPWFSLINLQIVQKINQQIEIYAGAKNLLNFMPSHPIMRPFDPFDKQISVDNPNGYTFDPTYTYAPVQGIKGFLGVRWNID